ncbi:MAG: hypothetical protein HQ568_04540 [Calditrichaeota bacterium]|nr:hypothetical protein [Calditrichota bacterium]
MKILNYTLETTLPDRQPPVNSEGLSFNTVWADGHSPDDGDGDEMSALGFLCLCRMVVASETGSLVVN